MKTILLRTTGTQVGCTITTKPPSGRPTMAPLRSKEASSRSPYIRIKNNSRQEYNGYSNNIASESKLPPALRWALEEDGSIDGDDQLSYERNYKANAHLAPIHNVNPVVKSQLYK
mmetsp:Transcript_34341/g.39685  ORF Transcript_34341/g.39685 Transcript_34341/m.39685 type:complete len:115 (-) Transcript_34341:82-426(-)